MVSKPARVVTRAEPVEHVDVEYMGTNPVGPVIQRIHRVNAREARFKKLVANAL